MLYALVRRLGSSSAEGFLQLRGIPYLAAILSLILASACGDPTAPMSSSESDLAAGESLSATNATITAAENFSCAEVTEIPEPECEALLSLYVATDGANWTKNEGWLEEGTQPSDWFGVEVLFGRVKEISLRSNNLSGNIPPELSDLEQLDGLSLGENNLEGQIPATLGKLTRLRSLDLQHNNELSGTIPSELGELSKLVSLVLIGNQLSGEIPPELGNLTQLRALYLSGNRLEGNIPSELGKLSNLWVLWLQFNELSGEIPATLGNLTNLEYLSLYQNVSLTGPLPLSLTNLSLQDFQFMDTQLCEPRDPEFQAWLRSIESLTRTGVPCGGLISFSNLEPKPGSHIHQELDPFAILSARGMIRWWEANPSLATDGLIEGLARADLHPIRHGADVCVQGSQLDVESIQVLINQEDVTHATSILPVEFAECDSAARISLRKYWIDDRVTVTVRAETTDGVQESESWSFTVGTAWDWKRGIVVAAIETSLGPIVQIIEALLLPEIAEAPTR